MAWHIELNFDKCNNKVKVTGTDLGRRFYKSSKLLKRTFYCRLMSKHEAMRLLDSTKTLDMLSEAMGDIGEMQSVVISVNDAMMFNDGYNSVKELLDGKKEVRLNLIKEAIAAL